MGLWGKKEKVCASCIYWEGSRNIEFTYIETRSFNGICKCKSGFAGLNTIEGSSCKHWTKVNKE